MKQRWLVMLAVAVAAGITACAQMPPDIAKLAGWTTLIDGEAGLENWNRVGDANWRPEDGAIVAYRGKSGFLVSKNSYRDFHLRAEFWADGASSTDVFLRVSNPKRIGADNAYAVNVAKVLPKKPGGKWNTLEVSAKGTELRVLLNGVETAGARQAKLLQGPIALHYGARTAEGGTIKWRKVQVRPLEAEKTPAAAKPAAGGGASKI
jgi:hypothetical protein